MGNPDKPSPDLYRTLLAKKFQDLIDSGPSQALAVMQMSVEHAPRLWQIAQDHERSDWGSALVSDDLMAPLLARIDWAADGSLISKRKSTLVELLERL